METLMLIFFEYILGYGLQAFIFIYGIYTFNRQKLVLKNYMYASILSTLITYIVRLLPITFGVHTIINMLIMFIVCIFLLKMPTYKTIRSMAIVMLLLLLSEMIDLAVISAFMEKEKLESAMNNPLQKAIIAVPVNILLLLLIILSYYILKKKGDFNRTVSS